jgi:hypothetical protein
MRMKVTEEPLSGACQCSTCSYPVLHLRVIVPERESSLTRDKWEGTGEPALSRDRKMASNGCYREPGSACWGCC